jgi:hypothetical protein
VIRHEADGMALRQDPAAAMPEELKQILAGEK